MPKKQKKVVGEVAVIGGEMLRDKIYTIRGRRVMLDYDLAKIYGYTTSAFNQQVARNIEKFEGEEFMFQLTREELKNFLRCKNCGIKPREGGFSRCNFCILKNEVVDDEVSRSQNVILKNEVINSDEVLRSQNVALKSVMDGDSEVSRLKNLILNDGRGGNVKYLPYAFTEQGVYMLMTVLRGELATKQSRALVMLFKTMKDYILENQELVEQREQLKMMVKVAENTRGISVIKSDMTNMERRLAVVEKEAGDAVKRSEISPILMDFSKVVEQKEFVLLDGEPMRASELYVDIYAKAKRRVYIVDDYISIKTLRHLQKVRKGVEVVIFSDNRGNYLHKSDYADFRRECPEVEIKFVRTEGLVHDRFIVIDYGEKCEMIYHCGASEKDAGGKVTVISRFGEGLTKEMMSGVVERLKKNRGLRLV